MTYLGDHTKNKSVLCINYTNKTLQGIYSSFISTRYIGNLIKIFFRKYHTRSTNQLGHYLAGLMEGDQLYLGKEKEKKFFLK